MLRATVGNHKIAALFKPKLLPRRDAGFPYREPEPSVYQHGNSKARGAGFDARIVASRMHRPFHFHDFALAKTSLVNEAATPNEPAVWRFYVAHQVYLIASALQWFASLIFLFATLQSWRGKVVNDESESDA